jgi:DNA/RNA-binding domain of Phe-tRNA-synthetase-like protein
LQLESVIHKGRSIPSVATLVEAMFMAELKNMLLTAGHDWDSLQGTIQLDVASGSESFVAMDGESYTLKPDDMMMADEAGVITSVIYGLARRTQIRLATRNVVFTVYGAPGINPGAVEAHLGDIRDNVLLVAPESQVTHMAVYTASHSELA